MRISLFGLLASGMFALCLVGCATTPPPPKPVVSAPPSGGPSTQATIDDLNARLSGLSDAAEQVPGNDDASDLNAMRNVLGRLRAILPILEESPTTPDFDRIVATLDTNLSRLAALPAGVTPAPHIDNALRNITAAVHEIADRRFPGNTEIAARLSKADQTLTHLDDYLNGPLQREQAALAARAIIDAMRAMVRAIPT